MDNVMKRIIHIFAVILITILIATVIALIILKYNIEGEDNMPFELSKIMVVSSADGNENENTDNNKRWNLKVYQNNDIYLEISKNKNYKDNNEIIDQIIIDNFKIIEAPLKGDIIIYRPTTNEGSIYENTDENIITTELIYEGKEESSVKSLKIANQGGLILFRYTISNLDDLISDDDEIRYDGTLLNKIGIQYSEIKFKVSFDISIKLKSDKTYTGTVELDLPAGNILEEGTSSYEKTNLKDVIFKRNLR